MDKMILIEKLREREKCLFLGILNDYISDALVIAITENPTSHFEDLISQIAKDNTYVDDDDLLDWCKQNKFAVDKMLKTHKQNNLHNLITITQRACNEEALYEDLPSILAMLVCEYLIENIEEIKTDFDLDKVIEIAKEQACGDCSFDNVTLLIDEYIDGGKDNE